MYVDRGPLCILGRACYSVWRGSLCNLGGACCLVGVGRYMYVVCGILGNLLNFVLTDLSLNVASLFVNTEEHDVITS